MRAIRYDIYQGDINTKSKTQKFIIGAAALAFAAALALSTGGANAVAFYSNGFEVDTSGWFSNGGTITRVASGANGVPSADGSFHAEVTDMTDFGGVFTRWGGYESTFPTNGYVTQVDVYVNMSENTTIGTDKRFDFSSAINNPTGSHRRDFIFHLGTDPLATGQWKASVSNNAPGWPSNPGRSPETITDTGWYTLKSTFEDNGGGVLAVDMDVIKKSDSSVVGSWTLSDPSDIIGTTVGGNRYGWFVTSDFIFLAIDNSQKMNIPPTPSNKDECKKGGWMNLTDDNNTPFRNQGQCVAWANHHDGVGQDDIHAN